MSYFPVISIMTLELNSIPMTNLTMIKRLSMVSQLTFVLETIPLSNSIMVINLRIVYMHNTNPMSNFTMVIYLTMVSSLAPSPWYSTPSLATVLATK